MVFHLQGNQNFPQFIQPLAGTSIKCISASVAHSEALEACDGVGVMTKKASMSKFKQSIGEGGFSAQFLEAFPDSGTTFPV
jgi:hypothetical protein